MGEAKVMSLADFAGEDSPPALRFIMLELKLKAMNGEMY